MARVRDWHRGRWIPRGARTGGDVSLNRPHREGERRDLLRREQGSGAGAPRDAEDIAEVERRPLDHPSEGTSRDLRARDDGGRKAGGTRRREGRRLFVDAHRGEVRYSGSVAVVTATSLTIQPASACDSPSRSLTNRPVDGARPITIDACLGFSRTPRNARPAVRAS